MIASTHSRIKAPHRPRHGISEPCSHFLQAVVQPRVQQRCSPRCCCCTCVLCSNTVLCFMPTRNTTLDSRKLTLKGTTGASSSSSWLPPWQVNRSQSSAVRTKPVRERAVCHRRKLGIDCRQSGRQAQQIFQDFPGPSWPTHCDPCEFLRKRRRSKTSAPPLFFFFFFCFSFLAFLLHDAPPSTAYSPQALITASAPSALVLLLHLRSSSVGGGVSLIDVRQDVEHREII